MKTRAFVAWKRSYKGNVECKVNHSRLDVRRKSGKSEGIILFQLGKTVEEFLDVKLVALVLVLVFAASSHLFCQC